MKKQLITVKDLKANEWMAEGLDDKVGHKLIAFFRIMCLLLILI
ncbi:hypothetical protein [Enterococcus mundtii]|nr:hypothetical protein [Enterococcus mundtii]